MYIYLFRPRCTFLINNIIYEKGGRKKKYKLDRNLEIKIRFYEAGERRVTRGWWKGEGGCKSEEAVGKMRR